MEKQSKKPSAAGKRKKFPCVLKNVYLWVILYFFDFGSLGTSCYNHLLYRLFAILFQFFTNVFFQCYPLFLCLSFKDTYSPFTQLFVSVKLCAVGTIPISPPYIRLHNPRPLVHWRSSRPHRRGGVFRRLLRQSNRNSKRKRHRVAFFPLALRDYG